MNCLNQTAAHLHARTGEEDLRLFALADYLRLVFRLGAETTLPLEDELALLQAYVQLIEQNRGIEIPFEFTPGLDDQHPEPRVRVQRHLSCDLFGAFMRALPSDAVKTAGMRLRFEGPSREWAYGLRVQLSPSESADIEPRLNTEIGKICERFALVPGVTLMHELLDSQGALTWGVRVATREVKHEIHQRSDRG